MNAICVGYQTTFWIHWSQIATNPARSPNASRTHVKTPPFQPVASSAATSAVGTRKRMAGTMKSVTEPSPYDAIAGSERSDATTTTVSIASCTTDMNVVAPAAGALMAGPVWPGGCREPGDPYGCGRTCAAVGACVPSART